MSGGLLTIPQIFHGYSFVDGEKLFKKRSVSVSRSIQREFKVGTLHCGAIDRLVNGDAEKNQLEAKMRAKPGDQHVTFVLWVPVRAVGHGVWWIFNGNSLYRLLGLGG